MSSRFSLGAVLSGCPRWGPAAVASAGRSFWSSTRSWRRCSRPGCPWRSRSTFSASGSKTRRSRPFSTAFTESAERNSAVGRLFRARRYVSGRLLGVAAGGGAQRQPGLRHPALRRLREADRRRPPTHDLGADLSGSSSMTMMVVLVGIIVLKVIPAFSDFYATFDRPLPLLTRVIVGFSNAVASNILVLGPAVIALVVAGILWFRQPSQKAILDRWLLQHPLGRGDRSEVLYVSSRAHALDAAGRGHSARPFARDCCSIDFEPIYERWPGRGTPARPGRSELRGGPPGPRGLSGCGREDGRSRGVHRARFRTC